MIRDMFVDYKGAGSNLNSSTIYAGKIMNLPTFNSTKIASPIDEELLNIFPMLREFDYPEMSVKCERESLRVQGEQVTYKSFPDVEKFCNAVVYSICDVGYPYVTNPFDFYNSIEDIVLYDMPRDSTPGLPWCLKDCHTNLQVITRYSKEVVKEVKRMLRLYCSDAPVPSNIYDLLKEGWCYPVRTFEKNEPHKKSKLREGKIRLIDGTSFTDQVFDRLIYGLQNKVEICLWHDIPSKPGFGVATEDQRELLKESTERVMSRMGISKLAKSDMSGFDWNVDGFMFMIDALRRTILCVDSEPLLARIYAKRAIVCSMRPMCLSNGEMYYFNKLGKMPSGWYNTSSTNSYIRAFLAYYVGCKFVMTMGDDAVEEYVESAKQCYEDIGFKVKEYDVFPSGVFEFCSMRFEEGVGFSSTSFAKPLFNLLNQKDSNFISMFKDFIGIYFRTNRTDIDKLISYYCKAYPDKFQAIDIYSSLSVNQAGSNEYRKD